MTDKATQAQLRRVLESWRNSLLDLSGRNRLLNFRHTRTGTLDLKTPTADELLAGLSYGLRFAPLPTDESDESDPPVVAHGIVTQKTTQGALTQSLRKLFRDSNAVFNDTGLWVLQLGVGFVKWRSDESDDLSAAPILLVPVRLERLGPNEFRLIAEDEDAIPNPALAVKMNQLDIAWPAAEEMSDLRSTLTAVRKTTMNQKGWEVSEDVVLGTFQSHKEAMFRDLLDHEAQILGHDLVQAIGLGPQAELPADALAFDPIDLDRIDDLQPPEDTPLVLDADSSQRQCVAAALAGKSFVMDGPPGTGKSQTIANVIAALMHAGKTVLFVSEKAAALDVVHNRLKAAGLDSFLLPLHSHQATRKQVAAQLGDALVMQAKAPKSTSPQERTKLKGLRESLSAYAAAMNEVRPPLNQSLHDVLGQTTQLSEVPTFAVRFQGELSADSFQDIIAAAESIAMAWRPVVEGLNFLWHDLVGQTPIPVLQEVSERSGDLVQALARHSSLAEPLGLDRFSDVSRLIELLNATTGRPEVPQSWLTVTNLNQLHTEISGFGTGLQALRNGSEQLRLGVGPNWDLLPSGLGPLSRASSSDLDCDHLTGPEAQRLQQEFLDTAHMLGGAHESLLDLAAWFNLPAPGDLEAALAVCRLTELAQAEARPEPGWSSPDGFDRAVLAAGVLERCVSELNVASSAAEDLFSDSVVSADGLAAVVQRFTDKHHGLGKLSGDYRADKRFITGLLRTGEWTRSVAERLPQAAAWQEATHRLEQMINTHAENLGRFWTGPDSDFTAIRAALRTAKEIIAVCPTPAVAMRASTVKVTAALGEAAAEVSVNLRQWQDTLAPAPAAAGRPRLAQGPLTDAAVWYSGQLDALVSVTAHCEPVDAICASETALTAAQSTEIILAINAYRSRRADFLASEGRHRRLLEQLYDGMTTDLVAVEAAFKWVASIRGFGKPFPQTAAEALLSSASDAELATVYAQWQESLQHFASQFRQERQPGLVDALSGRRRDALQLIDSFSANHAGPDEWRTYCTGLETLTAFGLAGLVKGAAKQDVTAERFPEVVKRTLLDIWIEAQLATDPRLAPGRANERDWLVADFQKLDKALVEHAHAQIIDACNAHRPARTNVGPAAILHNEAHKKSRHMPVRMLLEKTSTVVPLLKPCFMMSPLTVSQFLPPSYRFDVVIFDEASQVLPQDAVNCIYRGTSLIVAGDQKQMPPTNHFGASSESDDDEYDEEKPDSYESLLDMCKASGLIQSLSLRWHYRSRHESLIAFSNHEFYDGRLTTFPGSRESGDDVGVTFTKVDGVYERGHSRRNMVEATAVARRVVSHYSTRPHRSLGVVAMSVQQAEAIEDAVDQARSSRPDLDRFFGEDRLDGFFVKNLDTVQGDERDVIMLSVGYGPDQQGKLTMTFGPLNQGSGWRRLNVAVTRARYRVEVLASFTGADIRDSDNKSRNHFKRYLDYAEHGPAVLAQQPTIVDAAPESPFEEAVLDVLLGWGYDVQPQVGVGGYRIDMGVRHPSAPGRFVLGIECDGAMYHSSKAARDRDRLREGVLRGLGWKLHRIWGTDWYRNQPAAEARLRAAIEAAIAEPLSAAPVEQTAEPAPAPEIVMVESPEEVARPWAAAYRQARNPFTYRQHELHVREARSEICEVMRLILEDETPIHRDLLFRKVAMAWGIERIGSRIRPNLEQALRWLEQHDPAVTASAEFASLRHRPITARFPGLDGFTRKVGEIPAGERRKALLGIIEETRGISEDELIGETTRFFGWQRRGPDITRALSSELSAMAYEGLILGYPSMIVLADG